jgi:hypothetical protein
VPIRLLAGVVGTLVLLISALFSFGSSLVAPLGILATGAIAQRGGSRPTRPTTWVGAIIASMTALLLGAAVIYLVLPPDVRETFRATIDSAQTLAREEQAEELARRGLDTTAAGRMLGSQEGLTVWAGLFGGMVIIAFVGVMAGSAGWVASFLLMGAFAGRWPWRAEPDSMPGIGLGGPA